MKKTFFKLMSNSVFGKTMGNLRKHRGNKLVTTDRSYLVSEPDYHKDTTKVKINKPVYLGLSILDISKTVMYEFWYD